MKRKFLLLTALALTAAATMSIVAMSMASEDDTIEGRLNVLWVDPPASASLSIGPEAEPYAVFQVVAPNGDTINLDATAVEGFDAETLSLNAGSKVSARGEFTDGGTGFAASALKVRAKPLAAVTGRMKRAVLMCRFPDAESPSPKTKAYFEGMFGTGNGLTSYYDESSYGRMDFSATVYDWKTLPKNRSEYGIPVASGEMPNLDLLLTDCAGLHDADVDFTQVDGIDLIFDKSTGFGAAGIGGGHYAMLDSEIKSWRVTWVPSRSDQQDYTGLWAHEIGHSLGLPHSAGMDQDFSHFWDPMGNTVGYCFNRGWDYFDDDYLCHPNHYLAAHKDKGWLGWIPANKRLVVKPGVKKTVSVKRNGKVKKVKRWKPNKKTVRVTRSAQPGTGKIIVRIPVRKTTPAIYYTVEARMQVGNFDSWINLPGNGIIITRVIERCWEGPLNTSGCKWDYTPTNVVGANDPDAPSQAKPSASLFKKGETFKVGKKITIKVLKEFSDGYQVQIISKR